MNKKGFTLVELIIVIAVMAILAAIVVPRMSGITSSFRLKADERAAENFAREIEVKVQLGTIETAVAPALLTNTVLGETGTLADPKTDGKWYYYINGGSVYVGVFNNGNTLPADTNATTVNNTGKVTVVVKRDNAVKLTD